MNGRIRKLVLEDRITLQYRPFPGYRFEELFDFWVEGVDVDNFAGFYVVVIVA